MLRLFISIWLFYGIILTTCFNSRLISTLSAPIPSQEIKSLNDLFASEIKLYIQERFFTQFQELFINHTYYFSKNIDYYYDLDELLKDPTYATVTTQYIYIHHKFEHSQTNTNYSRLYELPDQWIYPLHFLFARGHLMFENFSSAALMLQEYGFQKQIYLSYINEKRDFDETSREKVKSLNIEQLSFPFVLLLTCYLISLSVFIFETRSYYWRHRRP